MDRRDFLIGGAIAAACQSGRYDAMQPGALRNVRNMGASSDGKQLCTRILQQAVDEVHRQGGGIVYLPAGKYLTGGLELKSRVTLYLDAGAVLLGSTSIEDYLFHEGPSRTADASGYHLLFCRDGSDVTLCGSGVIDGQGSAFWEPTHRTPPRPQDAWKDVATFDWKATATGRPSPMLEFARCRNVRVSGITLTNAAGWTMRPVACDGVWVDSIRIRNSPVTPNGDGIDITASQNVFVTNCDIATGDDAICLKSENPYGELLPTRDVVVSHCILTTSCNGFKIGTGSKGGFENIVFSNSVICSDSQRPLNERVIGGVNLEVVDGGWIDGVNVSNIRMENVRAPLFIRLGARTPGEHSYLRNVMVDGIDATGGMVTSSITGIPGLRPSDITILNSRLRSSEGGARAWRQLPIDENTEAYPESLMFGRLPAFGLYVRHADHVRLRNVEFIADVPEGRPVVHCENVEDLVLSGIESRPGQADVPVVDLRNVRRCFLSNSRVPEGRTVFASLRDSHPSSVTVAGCAAGDGETMLELQTG